MAACRALPPPASTTCHRCRSRATSRGGGRARVPCSSESAWRADLLLLDAANVLARAHADHRRGCRLPGDTVAAAFADWLCFLAALAEPQLMVAVFDVPRSLRQQPQQREQLAPEYLRRRRRRTQPPAAAAAAAGGLPPDHDPLRPYKQQVERLGGVCLQAAAGWEADDGLAAACRAVHEQLPDATLLLASGDSDMQQLLAPRVSWLQLHSQASLACPLGVQLITADAFQQQFGFPPAAYADWLAFTGKKEASISGSGVGGRTAARLLARYGSLEAVLSAAAAGELRGWGPGVQQLLGGGGAAGQHDARLRRNRQLFGVNDAPVAVAPPGMQRLAAVLEGVQRGGAGRQEAVPLAWRHPLHARRWRHLQQACEADEPPRRCVTPQGMAADAVSEAGGQAVATFRVCPCDVAAGGWPGAVAAAAQHDSTAALLPLLHGAMRQHVRLVRRSGCRVRLVLARFAV